MQQPCGPGPPAASWHGGARARSVRHGRQHGTASALLPLRGPRSPGILCVSRRATCVTTIGGAGLREREVIVERSGNTCPNWPTYSGGSSSSSRTQSCLSGRQSGIVNVWTFCHNWVFSSGNKQIGKNRTEWIFVFSFLSFFLH